MTDAVLTHSHGRVPTSALIPFILMTFAITWGLIGVYIVRPEQVVAWFGVISGSHPFFFLATWGPALAAFAIVLVYGGAFGFKGFLRRLALWRCSIGWVAFLLIGIPLTFAAGALVKGTPFADWFAFDSLGALLGVMVIMLFLGPVDHHTGAPFENLGHVASR